MVFRCRKAGGFISLIWLAFLGVGTVLAEGEVMALLDLENVSPGPLAAGTGTSLPLSAPNRITVSGQNQVNVEEDFGNGSHVFEGRSLVLRKETPESECAADYVFAGAGLSNPQVVTFEAELLFDGNDQKGNVSLNFRGPQNNLLYYLQIGAGGGLLDAAGEQSRRLDFSLSPSEPAKLRIVLDFAAGKVTLQINSQIIGEALSLAPVDTLKSFGFSIAGNRRVFAIRALNVSLK